MALYVEYYDADCRHRRARVISLRRNRKGTPIAVRVILANGVRRTLKPSAVHIIRFFDYKQQSNAANGDE